MKKLFSLILSILLIVGVGFSQAKWRYNPYTGQRDYYVEGLSTLSAAAGDIIYFTGTIWTRLAKGDNGQVLKLAAGIPSWAAESGGVTTFLELTDTPANYTDAGLKVLRVNSGATAVEFTKFIGTGLYDNGNSGNAITIDWNNGNIQTVTLTAVGVDITFTEPPHSGKCELWIIQDGTGSRTIDWAHEVSPKWPGDVEPVLSTAANAVDVVVFTFIGGTIYRGIASLDFK